MNNKLYGKLGGRCSLHGANHFGGNSKPKMKNRQRCVCELTSEFAYVRKTRIGKIQARRKVRRRNWNLP